MTLWILLARNCIVSPVCPLCHQYVNCVTSMSIVSHVCQLCHQCVHCVTSMSIVSPVCPLCHMYVSCVTSVSIVSPVCPLCHQYVHCVTSMSIVSPVCPFCHHYVNSAVSEWRQENSWILISHTSGLLSDKLFTEMACGYRNALPKTCLALLLCMLNSKNIMSINCEDGCQVVE